MKYYCVNIGKIISEKQYMRCLICTDPEHTLYDATNHGCKTQAIVGYQNDIDFKSNMTKLIREYKLKRICGTQQKYHLL